MLSKKKLKTLIKHAKNIKDLSEFKFKLGAIAFKGNEIISSGFNKNKSHPLCKKHFKYGTIHAEIDCLLHASPEKLQNSSFYIHRETKDGAPANAHPCPLCVQAMKEFGVKEVFWTIDKYPYWEYAHINSLIERIDRDIAYQYNIFKDEINVKKTRIDSKNN